MTSRKGAIRARKVIHRLELKDMRSCVCEQRSADPGYDYAPAGPRVVRPIVPEMPMSPTPANVVAKASHHHAAPAKERRPSQQATNGRAIRCSITIVETCGIW